MPKNDSISASSQREIIFSHLTLISVRENEKISRDSQEILMRKFVRKPDEPFARKAVTTKSMNNENTNNQRPKAPRQKRARTNSMTTQNTQPNPNEEAVELVREIQSHMQQIGAHEEQIWLLTNRYLDLRCEQPVAGNIFWVDLPKYAICSACTDSPEHKWASKFGDEHEVWSSMGFAGTTRYETKSLPDLRRFLNALDERRDIQCGLPLKEIQRRNRSKGRKLDHDEEIPF